MKILNQKQDLNKIYYYCPHNTAIEYILPENKILLSPLIKTNDPRENKDLWFSYSHDEENIPPIQELNTKFSKLVRKGCKVSCFSGDFREYQGCHLSNMWAHYGGNHKGVCLEINLQKFLEENKSIINNGICKKIKYEVYNRISRSSQPTINFIDINKTGEYDYIKYNFRELYLDYLYFTKGEEWQSESEVRILYFSESDNSEYCSILSSLECIHLGIDFNECYLPSIKNLCTNKPIYKMCYLPNGLKSQFIEYHAVFVNFAAMLRQLFRSNVPALA